MLKTIVIVVTVLVLIVILAVAAAFALTAGPVKAANVFFVASARDPAAGYALASPTFKASTPLGQWAAYVEAQGLTGYQGASWSSRSVENGVANLRGELRLRGGGALPVTVVLSHGAAGWQILQLKTQQSGLGDAASGVTPPSVPATEVAQLCRANLAAQAGAAFDSIDCADPLPAAAGRSVMCVAHKGPHEIMMKATLTSYASETRHFTIDCKVASHLLN